VETQSGSKLKQAVIALIILVIAFAGSRALLALKKAPEQSVVERPVPSVKVMPVELEDKVLQWQAQGVVKAEKEIQLVSEVSGRILSVSKKFHNGGLVDEGEELLRIDATDYEVALAEARAAQLTAELDYSDKRARYQKDSLSVKQSHAQLEFAKKRVAQAKRDLDNTVIHAPFAALIVRKQADLGQYVSRGAAIVELASTDIAELRVPIHRDEITLLADNPFAGPLSNSVVLSATVGGRVYEREAKLTRVEAQVDASTRVYYGVITIQDPYNLQVEESDPVRPPVIIGSFVNALVASKPLTSSVTLPVKALQNDGSVFVVDGDNKIDKAPVNVVQRQQDTIVINYGLQAKDRVVITPSPDMFVGMDVTVVQ